MRAASTLISRSLGKSTDKGNLLIRLKRKNLIFILKENYALFFNLYSLVMIHISVKCFFLPMLYELLYELQHVSDSLIQILFSKYMQLESMIRQDYRQASVSPADIRLGAVIITGETARKANARAVTEALSALAGDFVVATAGPALESILAGRGSGAAYGAVLLSEHFLGKRRFLDGGA